jgi:hypothetical protein
LRGAFTQPFTSLGIGQQPGMGGGGNLPFALKTALPLRLRLLRSAKPASPRGLRAEQGVGPHHLPERIFKDDQGNFGVGSAIVRQASAPHSDRPMRSNRPTPPSEAERTAIPYFVRQLVLARLAGTTPAVIAAREHRKPGGSRGQTRWKYVAEAGYPSRSSDSLCGLLCFTKLAPHFSEGSTNRCGDSAGGTGSWRRYPAITGVDAAKGLKKPGASSPG